MAWGVWGSCVIKHSVRTLIQTFTQIDSEIIILFCAWRGSVAVGVWTELTWRGSVGQPTLILFCRFTYWMVGTIGLLSNETVFLLQVKCRLVGFIACRCARRADGGTVFSICMWIVRFVLWGDFDGKIIFSTSKKWDKPFISADFGFIFVFFLVLLGRQFAASCSCL